MSCERSRRGCKPVSDCKMRRPTESVDNIVILVCRYPHIQKTSTVVIALIQQFFQQRKSQIVRLSIISESNVGTHTRKPSIHQRTIGGNVSIKPSSQPVNFNDVQINTAIVLSLARRVFTTGRSALSLLGEKIRRVVTQRLSSKGQSLPLRNHSKATVRLPTRYLSCSTISTSDVTRGNYHRQRYCCTHARLICTRYRVIVLSDKVSEVRVQSVAVIPGHFNGDG